MESCFSENFVEQNTDPTTFDEEINDIKIRSFRADGKLMGRNMFQEKSERLDNDECIVRRIECMNLIPLEIGYTRLPPFSKPFNWKEARLDELDMMDCTTLHKVNNIMRFLLSEVQTRHLENRALNYRKSFLETEKQRNSRFAEPNVNNTEFYILVTSELSANFCGLNTFFVKQRLVDDVGMISNDIIKEMTEVVNSVLDDVALRHQEHVANIYRKKFIKNLTENIYGPGKSDEKVITCIVLQGAENDQRMSLSMLFNFPCQRKFDKFCFPSISVENLQPSSGDKVEEMEVSANINSFYCAGDTKCDEDIEMHEKSEILHVLKQKDTNYNEKSDGTVQSDLALAFLLRTLRHLKGKENQLQERKQLEYSMTTNFFLSREG